MFAILLVLGCDDPAARPVDAPEQIADRMTLAVTEIAPDRTAGFRIVAGQPTTDVTIMSGSAAGGPTCTPGGPCVDLTGDVQVVTTSPTDANGSLLFETTMRSDLPVGTSVVFQAVTTDPAGIHHTSNVITRTILPSGDYASPPATNILVLVLDDVGVDLLATYGSTHPAVTPTIDRLAAEGVVFDDAWAMPWCSPSRASLQTGRYPRRTGYGINPGMPTEVELDPNLITIAELVEYSPWFTYSTAFVGKWHLSSFYSPSDYLSPIVQGWDSWSGSILGWLADWDPDVGVNVTPPNSPGYSYWQKFDSRTGLVTLSTHYVTSDNVADAIARISDMNEPWLMQVSFNSAHAPYHVPPADLHTNAQLDETGSVSDKQRAMIEAVDTEMAHLLDEVARERFGTTIFLLGDNGTPSEVLQADGDPEPEESKASVFDGGIRVPFIVSGAHVDAPDTRSSTLVSVVDVFPTIAEIVGVDTSILPGGSLVPDRPVALDGVSLLPALQDPPEPTGRTHLYAEVFSPGGEGPFDDDRRAIRDSRYKLILPTCGAEQFYEYVAGAADEGSDLLVTLGEANFDEAQRGGIAGLRADAAALLDDMVYDDAAWPASTASGDCP